VAIWPHCSVESRTLAVNGAAMAGIDENGHANLYVSGLPRGITEEQFQELFVGAGGNIVSCKCVPDKRYGFVKYARLSEAQAVIDAMNGYDFQGTTLLVKFADASEMRGFGGGLPDMGMGLMMPGALGMPGLLGGDLSGHDPKAAMESARAQIAAMAPDSIHVKGLPSDINEELVNNIFSAYGAVHQVQLNRYAQGCTAFLRMGSGEMSLWLVENLNNNIPQGLAAPVQVSFADQAAMQNSSARAVRFDPYGKRGGGGGESVSLDDAIKCAKASLGGSKFRSAIGDEASLTVKDLPGTADDLYLYKVFAPFGSLESVAVKRDPGGAWAVAFVRYLAADGASRAVSALNGCPLPDGAVLKVSKKGAK